MLCVCQSLATCVLALGNRDCFGSVPFPFQPLLRSHTLSPRDPDRKKRRQYLGWGCVTVAPALSRGEDRLGAGESLRRARPAAGGVAELVVESEPAVLLPNGCWCSSQSASTPAVAGDLKL